MKSITASARAAFAIVFLGAAAFAGGAQTAPMTTQGADAASVDRAMQLYAAAPAASLTALRAAESLAENGRWSSAFKSLGEFDKTDADPFVLALKISIVLRGSVRSDLHKAFGLVDLQPGQTLEELRSTDGNYERIPFDPVALAAAQNAQGVKAPGILSKALGDYYVDVVARFSGQWPLDDQTVMALAVDSYAAALAAGVFDARSLQNHGETLVRLNRGDESDAVYQKGIAFAPKDAELRYSYATTLAYRGKTAEALAQADAAIGAYADPQESIDALALAARLAAELGDATKEAHYYALADSQFPSSPTPGMLRFVVAEAMKRADAAAAAADALASSYGSNPNIVRTVVSAWYADGQPGVARAFLERNIAKSTDSKTIATLEFYLAVLIAQATPSDADRVIAQKALDDAETRFKVIYPNGGDVFEAIAGLRGSLAPQRVDGAAPAQ